MKEFWKVFIRDEKSFHLLSKVGKGPDAQRGFGPEGWGLESFTEFKGQGAGVFLSILIHNCIGLCFWEKCSLLGHVSLFATPWTKPAGLRCPWVSPGKDTGVGTIPFFRGSSQPFADIL